jgi:hypothetical protein
LSKPFGVELGVRNRHGEHRKRVRRLVHVRPKTVELTVQAIPYATLQGRVKVLHNPGFSRECPTQTSPSGISVGGRRLTQSRSTDETGRYLQGQEVALQAVHQAVVNGKRWVFQGWSGDVGPDVQLPNKDHLARTTLDTSKTVLAIYRLAP